MVTSSTRRRVLAPWLVLRCGALPIFLALFVMGTTGSGQQPVLPEKLEHFINTAAKLSASERELLVSGQAVTKLLDSDESKEVAVLGSIWIDAPIRRYIEAVKDIENFEKGGGFTVTKRISPQPQLADFDGLRLPDDDLNDLRNCRVGDCEIKLGEQALQRFRTEVDWTAPTATAHEAANGLMRQLALEYVTRYLEGGNNQLAVYRDRSRPTFVAQEFRDLVNRMPELTTGMPNMRRYLLEYPNVTIPDATSFLYWQETEFGLKPTIRISHLTIREQPEDTVVTSKMLYASHYFWTGLEVRALVPDPARGNGFWFVTVSRSRTDGLSGFVGRIIRGRVRSSVRDGALAGLRLTKQVLEGSQ